MSKVIWLDKEWKEELNWCPSQLYRAFKYNKKLYTCYLRWRHDNPWSFKLIEGDKHGSFVDYNSIFDRYGDFFVDSEYKEAEKRAEEIVEVNIEDLLK